MGRAAIPPEVVEFLEEGHSAVVGTRDARHLPDVQRAVGVRVDRASGDLTVFLPAATAEGTLANLRDNGRIALTLASTDHRSVQVKGRVLEIRGGEEAERQTLERYRAELAREWAVVGVPPRITLRLAHWPCLAVRFEPEALFVQTPGPGAGEALREGPRPLGPARGFPR